MRIPAQTRIWIAVAARLRPERMLYQGASEGRAVQVEIRPPLCFRDEGIIETDKLEARR
jgi:hypothetical protein